LTPAERLAYVLHDIFAVPFEGIGAILDRSPDAARQLASRGRRRIRGAEASPDAGTAARHDRVHAAGARHPAGARERRRRLGPFRDGDVFSIAVLTQRNGRITAIDVLSDPVRLGRVDLAGFDA
jgi:hypothetical protein